MITRFERVLTHGSTAVVAGSGVVYAWMKYFMTTDDPYAVVNHPLQPWMLDLHVAAAPLLVFALGFIAQTHIMAHLARGPGRPGRATGLIAVSCVLPMIATGYLIQIFTNETAHRASVWVHLTTSAAYTGVFLAHVVSSRRLAARRRTLGAPVEADDSGAAPAMERARLSRGASARRRGAVPARTLPRRPASSGSTERPA
jgi:hypothetical protein